MRILFVGDASNMHNTLAQALRNMGHDAVVASSGSRWMNTRRDINLYRGPGKLGALRYVRDIALALPKMRGYDVVVLTGCVFLELRPEKLWHIFKYLKRHNGKVVLSALGTDAVYYNACFDGHTFRYSDYMVGDKPSPYVGSSEYIVQQQDNWKSPLMQNYTRRIVDGVDGIVACLYEYYAAYKPLVGDKVAYGGIPIDTTAIQPHYIKHVPEKVKFFIGIQRDRNVIKGTDRLLAALKRVVAAHGDECEADVVENLPYEQYVERMSRSHVILDQLYSYTPATNALLGMAQGLVAISGAEPEYYGLIGERDNRPIINVDPAVEGDIDRKLELVLAHKDELPGLSRASRDFVVKHNDAVTVAQRYLAAWQRF